MCFSPSRGATASATTQQHTHTHTHRDTTTWPTSAQLSYARRRILPRTALTDHWGQTRATNRVPTARNCVFLQATKGALDRRDVARSNAARCGAIGAREPVAIARLRGSKWCVARSARPTARDTRFDSGRRDVADAHRARRRMHTYRLVQQTLLGGLCANTNDARTFTFSRRAVNVSPPWAYLCVWRG